MGCRRCRSKALNQPPAARTQVVSCVQWIPGRRGVVAVAATDPAGHSERLERAGQLSDAYVLIWNFR